MLKLGSLTLSSPFILAPLESVSDAAFRRLCHALGASFTWTEMIRGRGLAHNNKSTIELIDTFDADVPTGVQLLVTGEDELNAALLALEKPTPHFRHIRAIDLNFGCPSPEVIRFGAGPALLKRRRKLEAIFKALRQWKKSTSLPVGAVGAKIRLGLHRAEQDQKVYLPVVELANEYLDYLTIHARHARQGSDEAPLWSALGEAKARATVPIIGNGNIFSPEDWAQLQANTGVDGALIARGAIRSPWIFRGLLGQGPSTPTSILEIEEAEAQYRAVAEAYSSKPKFQQWHREGFARMRARFLGTSTAGADMPKNQNLT